MKLAILIAVLGLALPAIAAEPGTVSSPLAYVAATPMSKPELARLVGRDVHNAAGERIGKIEGIYINRDGSVNQVIVGVGGFLGIGEHDVALGWNNLHFMHGGRDIMVNISRKELKAMPKYQYAKPGFKGTVFGDLD